MPSPAAGDDGRNALMEAIRRGANLKRGVSTDQDKKPRKSNAMSDTDDKTKTGAGERTKNCRRRIERRRSNEHDGRTSESVATTTVDRGFVAKRQHF